MRVTKPLVKEKMWVVFSPDGYAQVRSLAYTKKDAQTTWEMYEAEGYYVQKVEVTIKIRKIHK